MARLSCEIPTCQTGWRQRVYCAEDYLTSRKKRHAYAPRRSLVKLTCKQQDLAKGLSTVSHAVSTRSTLPILSNILLVAEGDQVRLSATNLEIAITCYVPANIQEPGTTTIPAKLLTDFVNSLPTADVKLELPEDGNHALKVSGQGGQATIRGMDAGDYPTIPSGDEGEQAITLDAAELR